MAHEQLDAAIASAEAEGGAEQALHERVHDIRKRCKKLRGLARLARPAMEDYRRVNRTLRDIARGLASARDRRVLIETHEQLLDANRQQLDGIALAPLEQLLRQRAPNAAALRRALADASPALRALRGSVGQWRFRDDREAVPDGIKKTYKRGRKAMRKASEAPSTERYHDWRKRAKYHRYHLRLLQNAWPPVLKSMRKETARLSSLLGDEHDLGEYASFVRSAGVLDGNAERTLLSAVDRERARLRASAEGLGRRVFAERPKAASQRLASYLQAWQPQRPVELLTREAS